MQILREVTSTYVLYYAATASDSHPAAKSKERNMEAKELARKNGTTMWIDHLALLVSWRFQRENFV